MPWRRSNGGRGRGLHRRSSGKREKLKRKSSESVRRERYSVCTQSTEYCYIYSVSSVLSRVDAIERCSTKDQREFCGSDTFY